MTLITESYRTLNRRLHDDRPDYGTSGKKWAPFVRMLMDKHQSKDILDYGCGKRTLEQELGFPIRNYDPAVAGLEKEPTPADIVVCGDVLEHIEPDCLDAVLTDLARVSRKACFMVVATRPAGKNLPDGRNAHLIQKPARWWLATIMDYFDIEIFQKTGEGEFLCLAVKQKEQTFA